MTRLFVIAASILALVLGLTVVPRVARAEVQAATETPTIEFQPMCWPDTGATPPPIVTVKIVGHSFEPSVKVNVQDLHNPQTFQTVSTDAYGMFATALNVSIVQGGNSIRVSDASGEQNLTTAVFNSCAYGQATARLMPACSSDAVPTLHIVGTGWASSPSDALIEILVDGNDTLVDPVQPPSNGNFDVTRSIKGSLSSGDHGISIRQNGYQGSVQVVEEYAQMNFRIGDCPAATVTPGCATSGAPPDRVTLTVSGTGFDPSSDLHVVFDPLGIPQEFVYQYPTPPSPDPYATGASPPPPSGDFGPITIAPFARGAGEYTVELIQRDAGNDVTRDWVTSILSPCHQPTLAPASPECGDAVGSDNALQYSITVEGSDFVPNESITIVFDPDHAAGSDYPPVAFNGKTDANGALYAAISPSYRPPNIYRILAYQDTDAGHFEANTTFTVPCIGPPISPPPSLPPGSAVISVNPTCAVAAAGQSGAYSLGLTGGGFAPGPVTVVLDPAGTPFTGTVEADVSGYVSATFVADGKDNGTYQLVASQDNNGTHIEASSTLTVPCQTLTIDPTCEAPADGLTGAYALTAKGLGFDPGLVDLVFDPTGLSPAATQVQADATGVFSAPLLLTGKPAGVYDLVASQESSYGLIAQASAQLVVPCGATVLRMTPDSGPRGLVPTVEGFGFPPNASLVLEWDIGIGASQPVTVQTDAQGYFSRQLLIFQHDFLGVRHVTVATPDNAAAYPGLTATYLVAAAAIQPPFSADDQSVPSPEPVILQR